MTDGCTLGIVGEQLAAVRDRIFTLAQPQRHHLVLNLNAGSGLPQRELRRVPEGGVYACTHTPSDTALQEQAAALPELMRPIVLPATLTELPGVLATQAPDVRFDRILGRNALVREPDKVAIIHRLAKLLRHSGYLCWWRRCLVIRNGFIAYLDPTKLDADLYERLVAAEEAIYAFESDPMVNWMLTSCR